MISFLLETIPHCQFTDNNLSSHANSKMQPYKQLAPFILTLIVPMPHPILRGLYRPIQPTANEGTPLGYREILPTDALRPFIHCYWVLRSPGILETPWIYRIVSDGCIDLLINCTTFEPMILAGTADSASTVSFDRQIEYFGIRFLPGCFSYFFKLPLKEVVNHMLPCQDVWGNRLNDLESRLFEASSFQSKIEVAENFLVQQLVQQNQSPDLRLLGTLSEIYKNQGQFSIEKASGLGVSPRQLRRLFDKHLGVSPKTFARIVRFQSILHSMVGTSKKEWGQLCYDFGYYDQPHFIHEFESFSGVSPMSIHFPSQ